MSSTQTKTLDKEIIKNTIYNRHLFYDEIADEYEKEIIYGSLFYYEHYRAIADFLIRHILKNNMSGSRRLRVLDVGCGTGFWTKIFRDLGYETTGLDLSIKSVEKAFSRGLEVFVNDASHISIRKESFDIVSALSSVINHLDGLDKFLRDAWYVLRGGGYLVFDFDSSWSLDNIYEALIYKNSSREILSSIVKLRFLNKGYKIYWDLGDTYIRVYSPLEIFNSLRKYRFEVLRFEPIHMISSAIPVRIQEKADKPFIRRIVSTMHEMDNKIKKKLPFFIAPFSVSYIVLARKIPKDYSS